MTSAPVRIITFDASGPTDYGPIFADAIRFLPAVRDLVQAAADNSSAPAWAISVWTNALCGPFSLLPAPGSDSADTANVVPTDTIATEALRRHLFDHRFATFLTDQLCAGRKGKSQPPANIVSRPWGAMQPCARPPSRRISSKRTARSRPH